MTETFITHDEQGFHTYTGRVVARSASTIVVTLTEPFDHIGHSVLLPVETIVWEGGVAA